MRFTALLTFFFCLVFTSSLASCGTLFDRTIIPKGWAKLAPANANAKVSFTVALKNQNLAQLESLFWEVSDPDHAKYQEYMTIDEINALVAPSASIQSEVKNYFLTNGVRSENIRAFPDALDIDTTVAVASKLFNTNFYMFGSSTGGKLVAAFGEYSLPDSVHQHVELVSGLSSFPIPHLKLHKSPLNKEQRKLLQLADIGVIPQSVAAMYGVPTSQKESGALSTSQGVIEFQGESFSTTDLLFWANQVSLPIANITSGFIVGPNAPSSTGVESTLDIQFIAGVNREAQSWFWLEDGQGWLYQFGIHFFNTATVPQVSSISYGWWEGDQCTIDPTECQSLGVSSNQYTAIVNVQFQKIALRGLTLLASSGDSGANGRTDGSCLDPQLRAAFPSSSPYLTSVGATQVDHPVFNIPGAGAIPACQAGYPCVSGGQEVAVSYNVSGFASGGGFSNIAAMPAYQKAAVNAYLSSGVKLPPAGYFNVSGRGAPDIAALGHNCMIAQGGSLEPVGGTSCSSPIAAGVMALLNQESVKISGKPLGFLNPFLYKAAAQNAANFQDITVGDNICTEQGCGATCTGFLAAKGWDPVSGLGSPNFNNLKSFIGQIKAERDIKFPRA